MVRRIDGLFDGIADFTALLAATQRAAAFQWRGTVVLSRCWRRRWTHQLHLPAPAEYLCP